MTLTLKVGKRYVRRDGTVSNKLTANGCIEYPFLDGAYAVNESGRIFHSSEHNFDLVSEYKPAKPEWRVVIPCPSRDGARLMAAFLKEKNPGTKITVEKSS